MRSKNTRSTPKSNELSKEFLEEFGLVPSGKEKLADKVGKPGQNTNTQNTQDTQELVGEYLKQQQWIPSEDNTLSNKKGQ
ncbi:hypothetical protein [Geosporobacter ferrireducens]|uniref:Uncharacterized protein n=1 Tax=Geosporobacter ferrireducens TaxID=1424294 RepID=A0A1D8GP55_9FIRM|nr:hypothetical protein [Geosporobacter ferrireducens]AOT72731.1 hypothetical protein Gferi_26150 [Geosporobacter ferrireducens]MTI55143.1 hypothetical protein [Geosporobacter ferrireducens]